MTIMNMPVILGAVAQKPATPVEERRLPREGNNSSFYKQLKQMNLKKNLPEKENTNVMARVSRAAPKPGEKEVKVESEPEDKTNTQIINQTIRKPDNPGAPNPEEMVKSQVEGDTPVETADDEAGIVVAIAMEILGHVSPYDNRDLVSSVTPAALIEQGNSQSTDNPEPVAAAIITAANYVNNELFLSEVTVSDQEDSSSLQIGIPLQGCDEPVPGLGKPGVQTDDAQSMAKVTLQQSDNHLSDLSIMNKSQQIGTSVDILSEPADSLDEINNDPKLLRENIPAVPPIVREEQQSKADTTDISPEQTTRPNESNSKLKVLRYNMLTVSPIIGEEQQIAAGITDISPEQAARPDNSNSDLRVLQDSMPIKTPIMGMENNTDQSLKDEPVHASTRSTEEAKPGISSVQTAHTGEKAVKEAPEVKPWVRELLPEQSGKQKPQSQSGAETKQNSEQDPSGNNKRGPSTDVKKLIDFETHRLNASRFTPKPVPVPESQTKAGSDDAKAVVNALSRSDTDLFRATANTNGTDSSRNLPTAREIIAQIVQKAEILFTNKLSEVKIDLKPEFLGRLTIKVMVEEGVVTARFIAENQQVKHMLESNLHTLRQNLESQGIRVERTEVNVQLNNGGMFDGSEGSRQYLWEEGQFSENHQHEGPYPGNQYTGGYEELDSAVTQAGSDYEYNENGTLNFLV